MDELSIIPRGALLIGTLGADPAMAADLCQSAGLDACSMELAAAHHARAVDGRAVLSGQPRGLPRGDRGGRAPTTSGFPMMMTAAGTVPAANAFIMGAGVAGLQAIATARRLGGRVSATDVRPAAKEEIKSLGASFVGYEDDESKAAQTAGGYAKQLSAPSSTPSRPKWWPRTSPSRTSSSARRWCRAASAPTLVTAAMVASMKPGSGDRGHRRRTPAGIARVTRPGELFVTDERREDPRLHQLGGAATGGGLGAVCAQPPHLPVHLLGQGRQGAEAAGG